MSILRAAETMSSVAGHLGSLPSQGSQESPGLAMVMSTPPGSPTKGRRAETGAHAFGLAVAAFTHVVHVAELLDGHSAAGLFAVLRPSTGAAAGFGVPGCRALPGKPVCVRRPAGFGLHQCHCTAAAKHFAGSAPRGGARRLVARAARL